MTDARWNGGNPPPNALRDGIPPYGVSIRKVENGFIVVVGCKTFVSKEWSEVWTELGLYFAAPDKAIDKWTRRNEAHG